jgi:hypothetical protein
MLGRKNYTQEELEQAKTAVGQQLAAYKKLVKAVESATSDPKVRRDRIQVRVGPPTHQAPEHHPAAHLSFAEAHHRVPERRQWGSDRVSHPSGPPG